ncbi:hypothetical protein AXF42_Ash000383 [Apostasia shenzhenica]|uniref:Uncharacterized protein n=1 Tax=Apostasia shenzhenica TaxID=1088818 RepID=A0A2I0AG90_9ASPA|nr:hypothetical protein AXF42_Ash000383 [Apostasia shenzhenica]
MGFIKSSCMPVLAKTSPAKSSPSPEKEEVKTEDMAEKERQRKMEEKKKKKMMMMMMEGEKSNLHKAAMAAPFFPFHSRPGLR